MGDDRSFVIVTGMSGAGRSSVLKKLEDDGYFCVDNLPIPFLNKFIKFVFDEKEGRARVALGLDIRNGKSLEGLLPMLENIKNSNIKILFLDAGTETLVRRYKETRRIHPLSASLGNTTVLLSPYNPISRRFIKYRVYSLFNIILTAGTGMPRFSCFLHPSNSKPYL